MSRSPCPQVLVYKWCNCFLCTSSLFATIDHLCLLLLIWVSALGSWSVMVLQVALLRGHVLELEERLRVLQALQATQTHQQANGPGPKEGAEEEGTGVAAAALEKRCATLLNQQVAVHTILESKIKVRFFSRNEVQICWEG